MDASNYFIPAFALCVGLAVKLPALVREWRDPLVRSVCLVIALGGAGFVLAAPTTIAAVNEATGIPNFSGPLVYANVSAFSASCLLLIVHWRGGPPAYVRRISRRWQLAYFLVITTLVVLFALGDAPVDRLTDFDTYYATTPFIREMIVLYLLAHMTAALVTTVLCRRWARQVHGWLRAGLWILVVGWLLNLSFSSLKLAAVGARWAGRDWDQLSTSLAPLVSAVGAFCAVVGFLLPLVGPWLVSAGRAVTAYRRLGPLWRELCGASPRTPLAMTIPWYSSPHMRLTCREAGIQDGLSLVRASLDDDVRSRAQRAAEAAGHSGEEAAYIGRAAMIAAAAVATRRDAPGEALCSPEDSEVPSTRGALLGVSNALRTSPIVAAVREDPVASPAEDGEKSPT
ncbi:MAB_1171c family putative transporter [Streptomyces sp. NPDC050704]|uniref:MAB_1171c family putative transporter n=1 Tax=Streptomyces sp. NPDC050704 TaxID=3157219 RepID=UPI0034443460